MAKKNFYAVKAGRQPGIYKSWPDCQKQTAGFSGAIFKGFESLEEAKEFMGEVPSSNKTKDNPLARGNYSNMTFPANYAFVDGSFNNKTKTYGYGGFLIADGTKHIFKGAGSDSEMASMRNVAGEILGSMTAIKTAIELGLKEISIFYDYAGIEHWAKGEWKRNKKGTIEYKDFIDSVKEEIIINFIKVKAHSDIPGNEEADVLAKEAVGLLN